MTIAKSTASRQDDCRLAFLRHLPRRVEALEQHIKRHQHAGWDAGGIAQLSEDVRRLATASDRYQLIESSQSLMLLEQMLGGHIAFASQPDSRQSERMLALTAAIALSLNPLFDAHQPLSLGIAKSVPAAAVPAIATSKAAARPVAAAQAIFRRVFHFSDGNSLAREIGRQLEVRGYEVEPAETVEELIDLLNNLSPQLVLVDVSRMSDLAAVGDVRRDSQLRAQNQRIQLVAMAEQDNLQARLAARRAGVDALLVPPFNALDVLRPLEALLTPAAEEKLRVLIVEDNRAEALFAQSVLINAGIQAQVELDPLRVLAALEAVRPDLVLMDMHMPGANGVQLTALIREHPVFMRTPIVFLTGDSNPEVRLDAIKAGGDDFLSKPIRPRHLIDTVHTHVRRRREPQQATPGNRDEATGLHQKAFVLDRINDALSACADRLNADHSGTHQATNGGGALYLEIDGATQLRDRLGIAVFEQLLADVGRLLADELQDRCPAAQFNDDAFLILATDLDGSALEAFAAHLHDLVIQHPFEAGGEPLRLHASVGVCPLHPGFDESGALLDAAERACRKARNNESSRRRYQSSRPAELDPEAVRIAQLRDAIGNNGLDLIYQPIAAVQGSPEAQYQTLLRMHDANGCLLPAGEILPLAERAGLMIDIDRWVLTRALDVLRQQRDNGQLVRLFVPQAMTTIAAVDQGNWLKAELRARNVPGSALVIECRLEDALFNPPALTALAHAMSAEGIRLCIGQFELTSESDRLLEQIPLGFIKLASKYAASQDQRDLQDEMCSAIDRAHRHRIQVIGHRVEDTQAAAMLWMSGVDFIQGNLVQSAAGELDFDFSTAVL